MMKIKGDKSVQACIQSKLQRETKWKNKSSNVCQGADMIAQLVENRTYKCHTKATHQQNT